MRKKLLLMLSIALLTITASLAFANADKFGDNVKSVYMTGAKADYLAGAHSKLDVSCADCHGDVAKLDDSEKTINKSCISCHGDMAEMGKVTKAMEMNPHDSHLGQINCTSCHSAHAPSRAYCLNCHSIEMDMKYGGPSMAQIKESFKLYDKIVPNHIVKTDIVVVGAGGAGMVAAITAKEAGANVIIVEKMPIPGGNTQLSAGGMNAAFTDYQKVSKITDSPEVMYEDTMKGGKNMSNPELARILAFNSDASMKWLTKKGIILSYVGMGGGAANKRFHAPDGGNVVGAYLSKNLKKLVADKNIDMRVNSKVVKILLSAENEVMGVLVKGKHEGFYEIHAKSVIFTTGGFSANAALVESLQPSFAGMTTSNQPGAQGDGMIIGEIAGAQLIDMEMIQIHPTVAMGSQILITEAVRGTGAIMVNHEGKRFVNELTTRDKASAAVLAQTGKTAYLIFDDNIRKTLKQIDGYFHLGLVKQGKTPAELAAAIKAPAANLENTLKSYNDIVVKKNDTEFGRANIPFQINQGNYYAIEIAPGVHYTMGGLKIDTNAQVIGKNGKPMKNFYAAGEVTGGVHGANRLGGNSISETITFGRLAGESAVKNAK